MQTPPKLVSNRDMTPFEFKSLQGHLKMNSGEIAKYLGISQNTVSRYRKGHTEVPTSVALALRTLVEYNAVRLELKGLVDNVLRQYPNGI